MKLSRPAAAGAAAAVLAAACGSAAAPAPPAAPVIRGVAVTVPAVSPAPYVAADVQFGLSLLGVSCAQNPAGNLVLSPASLGRGLGMAYLGARGATARAMAAVLHLPRAAGPALVAGLRARTQALRGLSRAGVTVAETDQLWADPRLAPLPGYLNAIATGFGAGLGQVPLARDPARAAAQIDAAVAAATGGHITRLLSASDLQNVIFVLTDALYLNARWVSPFPRANDRTAEFTTEAGQRVQARYMLGDGYASAAADGWTAVRLPYRGGRLAMTALLPPVPRAGQPGAGCQLPSAADLSAIRAALAHPAAAAVELPKVSLRSRLQLKAQLTKLGMGVAFGPSGDFSGMNPAAAGLGAVVHAATLRVGEAGTTATAATAVTVLPTAGRSGPVVQFSRPYLMLITDTRTGEPLFLARVANPDLP
jgi:serine protease inhibitor